MSFHLFQQGHQLNYQYTDKVIRSYINMGGALFHIYKWEKVKKNDGTYVPIEQFSVSNAVFNENSNRIYSKETYDLYGVTNMNNKASQLTLLFSGLSDLDQDEKEITFHYNSMIEQLGRKIISGDVIEWTWLRDLDVLGNDRQGFNKFYVVTDSARDENGWSANYTYHLWKIKCKPITKSPEYEDLINKQDGARPGAGDGINGGEGMTDTSIKSLVGGEDNGDIVIGEAILSGQEDAQNIIMNEILSQAEEQVSFRKYDEHHVYIDEDTDNAFKPYVLIGDGIDDNINAQDIAYGEYFPNKPVTGDYFLRIDYNPPRLFKRNENNWELIEFDEREKWTGVPATLRNIINQNNSFKNENGEDINMRQNIKDLVRARVKKEHNRPLDWKSIGVNKP